MSSQRRGLDFALFAGASVAAGALTLPVTTHAYATVGETITRTVSGWQFVKGATVAFGAVSLTNYTAAIPTDDVFGYRAGAGSSPVAKLGVYSGSTTGVQSTFMASICRQAYNASTSVCGATYNGSFTSTGAQHVTVSTSGTYATTNNVNDYYFGSIMKSSTTDLIGLGNKFVACW